MVIWMDGGVPGVGVESGILRAAEVQAVVAAGDLHRRLEQQREQLLLEAREQAQSLIETAMADAAAQVDAARGEAARLLDEARDDIEQSIRRGYDDGRREAIIEWHERLGREREDKSTTLNAMHSRLAEIVTTAVERIVHTEQREALYQRALRSVQSLTRGASSLALRVSSADYEQARAALSSTASQPGGLDVDLSVDPSLKPGSCIFESELGILDASLEVQLEGLRAAMGRAVRKALAAEGEGHAGLPASRAGSAAEAETTAEDEYEDEDEDEDEDEEEFHG